MYITTFIYILINKCLNHIQIRFSCFCSQWGW